MSGDKDLQTQRVYTLDELELQSEEIQGRYDRLTSASFSDPERGYLVVELKIFLGVCAAHGRYVPIGTPDRRSLRNLVDYWKSRLRGDRYDVTGIRGLEAYDPNAGVPLEADCPYPGLEPYDDSSQGDFFGREKLAGEYANKLEAQGVFLIVGGSGSGKSSVALAGVRPACQTRHPDWRCPRPVKPGSDPLGALAASIAEATAGDADDLARRLKEQSAEAVSVLGAALDHTPILLILDQFEEVLTLCRDAEAQKAFADALLALASAEMVTGARRFYLLFTLRTDHLGRFDENPGLKPLRDRLMKPDCSAYLPAMQLDEILQAILKPAQRVRLRFVPAALAEKLAGQTASLINGLPLLQFALQHLWKGRDTEQGCKETDGKPRALDFIHEKQLEALPDVSSALGTHAERVYQALESQQKKAICERLILELLFLDENLNEPVRRRRPVAELCDVIGRALGAGTDDVLTVIKVFDDERLLRRFSEKGTDQLEVAHEALLRHWTTISKLVFGDEVKARLFRIKEVQKEATDWINNGRSNDWLKKRGEPLTKVEQDVDEFYLIDPNSQAYVSACRADENRIKHGEEEKRQAEKKAQEALLAQKEAERERAEAEKKRAIAAQEIAEQKACLSEAEAQAANIAKQVAEQQAKLSEANRLKKEALDAKERAEKEEQGRAKRRKRVALIVCILGPLILLLGASYVKQRNDSNVNAIASLSDRLPPWEGLDLTQTLAENNKIFSGALGHALERMNDARIVGVRGSGLTLLGDGNVLLSVPAIQAKDNKNADNRLCLYGLEKNGLDKGEQGIILSPPQGVCAPQSGSFERGNIGAEIVDGPLKGKRLFVAIFREVSDGMLIARAWLIDLNNAAGGLEPVGISGMQGAWSSASQIAIHPGGREASFGLVSPDGKGQLFVFELRGGSPEKPYDLNASPLGGNGQIVNSLGYVSLHNGWQSLVLATQAGVSCGEVQPAESAVAIATVPESVRFAVGRGNGEIELASCYGQKLKLPPGAPKGNPFSVSLQRIGSSLLLSYQMEGGGLQCYEVTEKDVISASCNSRHPVATMAVLGKDTQVTIELAGMLPVVRRFPAEFALEKSRFKRVGWQGNTVLCRDGTDSRADAPGEEICPETQHENRDAVLSPLAEFKAVMERNKNKETRFSVWKLSAGAGIAPISVKNENGFVAGNAFAIDKYGRLAYFRAGFGNKSELTIVEALSPRDVKPQHAMIGGGPTCMSFSPDGAYLLVGTGVGRGYRYAIKAGELVSSTDIKEVADISAAITACAVNDDGEAVLGLRDGNVLYFDRDFTQTTLTERVVYLLSAEVKAVRIDSADSGLRRVTALGAWQPNNCLYPALPGQSLRVWELVGKDTNKIPVSNTCFPNQPVLALGGWTTKEKSRSEVGEPTPVKAPGLVGSGSITAGAGIRLLLPQGVRWHPCPGCSLKDESDSVMQKRLIELAEKKDGIVLDDQTLDSRYGLKRGLW